MLHHSMYFQRRKKLRPGGLGALECQGALVHCTTYMYCYATENDISKEEIYFSN